MPARAAAARTTSQSTFPDMPSPHTRPALLMARTTLPCVMLAASVHASTSLSPSQGSAPCERGRLCRRGPRSPSAPLVPGLTRASVRVTRHAAIRIRSTSRPWHGHAAHEAWRASTVRSTAVPVLESASSPADALAPHTSDTTNPAASSGLSRPASAASMRAETLYWMGRHLHRRNRPFRKPPHFRQRIVQQGGAEPRAKVIVPQSVLCGTPPSSSREYFRRPPNFGSFQGIRGSMRRFIHLTNAFSKKVENHAAAVAIYFMYNFARVHQTLRVTPAMEAGLADHVWAIEEIVSLL